MTTDMITNLSIDLLPIVIAIAIAVYKLAIIFLSPESKQARLADIHSTLSNLAVTATRAAEQSGAIGSAKKAMATSTIVEALSSAGVKVPGSLVSDAIEGAVYYLNQLEGSFTPPQLPTSTQAPPASASAQDATVTEVNSIGQLSPVQA